jgi:glucose/arabinose dehydrogenase
LLRFPPHAAAVKFDVVPASSTNWAGHICVALFGDEAPMTAPSGGPRVGRAVVRVDPADWSLHPMVSGPLARPIDVRFNPMDGAMYLLDFGEFEMTDERKVAANAQSGKLWRVLMNV